MANNLTVPTVEHFVFFEALGAIVDRTERGGLSAEDAEAVPEYRLVLAGLLTLRLVDGWVAAVAEGGEAPSLKHIASAQRAVGACEASPVRNALEALVTAMTESWGAASSEVSAQAFAYARLLQDDSAWAIAADAYQSVVACSDASHDAGLVPVALLNMAACLRTCGRLTDADRAYARALEAATAAGDTYHALLSRIGAANAVANRGNLPRAEALLEAIIRETEALVPGAPGLMDVIARAKHDRGVVLVDRGDPARATDDFFDAFEAYTEPKRRTRALVDLANALTALGAHAAARDAFHLSLGATADREVRWVVSINLLELAQLDGEETVFERWRRDIGDADLPPRLRAYYLLYSGFGLYRFGRPDAARAGSPRSTTTTPRSCLARAITSINAGAPLTSASVSRMISSSNASARGRLPRLAVALAAPMRLKSA